MHSVLCTGIKTSYIYLKTMTTVSTIFTNPDMQTINMNVTK